MRLLVLSSDFPRPDKASGDLRLYTILQLLAGKHDVVYCAIDNNGLEKKPDEDDVLLSAIGIKPGSGNLFETLRVFQPELVWFEFYYLALSFGSLVRRQLPRALQVVDSVDVHFNRLAARARLTGSKPDQDRAAAVRGQELAAYASADLVLAVSEDDKRILLEALPALAVDVVPNIHRIPPFPDFGKRRFGELIFIGNFGHEPNVDAVKYFCKDVLPLITARRPEVVLKIIGSNSTPDIAALAGQHVEVLGHVPDTAPFLEHAYISVAPLRYGGGMKGKVGEAMSFGLPVVTTSFGAEGFGLKPGRELLVADGAADFAACVNQLLDDPELHHRIARSGYEFISANYSVTAVDGILQATLQQVASRGPKPTHLKDRLVAEVRRLYEQHLAWRVRAR